MADTENFRALILSIADLYAAEGRAGGDQVAAALRQSRFSLSDQPPASPPLLDQVNEALALSSHPIAGLIANVLPVIRWQHAGLENGRIRADVAVQMLTAEIIGPTGMIHSSTVRAGLFLQAKHVAYTSRSHAAEETYVALTDSGRWSLYDSAPAQRTTGEVIFHPSMAPHATFTGADPLLAIWRWSGDIAWESYVMAGTTPTVAT